MFEGVIVTVIRKKGELVCTHYISLHRDWWCHMALAFKSVFGVIFHLSVIDGGFMEEPIHDLAWGIGFVQVQEICEGFVGENA